LPFPELARDLPLLPVRMLNEFQYCPRLSYLEWVQGEWAESADTTEGRHVRRRVDQRKGDLPAAEDIESDTRIHARSITLSSNALGLMAKMDLIEVEDGAVTPVDYKRGKRPHVPRGAYDPERVQLCAQGMILEAHGYRCGEGVLYFAESRERVAEVFDDELRELTRNAINGLRAVASGGVIPAPLVDSPKCPRCSLVGICLPDEVNYLKRGDSPPRPISVLRDEALPVYVQARSAKVAKNGETLHISIDDQLVKTARLGEVSQLVPMGNVYVTTPCLHELMSRDVTVSWHSFGGWFMGHTVSTGHKNVEIRTLQYKASFDAAHCLRIAKRLVIAKIQNSRTLLRRNWKEGEAPEEVMEAFKFDVDQARRAKSLDELLGFEGNAAARYFGQFQQMIRRNDEGGFDFDFNNRNRRPPIDPVNALLSFGYSLLTRTWTVTLSGVGFDPYRGFYHQPRYGRPSLALDMMEPFRPLVVDSSVLQVINNGEVKPSDFKSAVGSVALNGDGRKRFIAAFDRCLEHEITHPMFGYKLSYRRLLELQARLLARHLLGEIDDFPGFVTR
jgi:CRISP-associated protein Cas1